MSAGIVLLSSEAFYAACIIAFSISGIWHGAGFQFILFGLLHGIISVIQQIYSKWCKSHKKKWVAEAGNIQVILWYQKRYIENNMSSGRHKLSVQNISDVLISLASMDRSCVKWADIKGLSKFLYGSCDKYEEIRQH